MHLAVNTWVCVWIRFGQSTHPVMVKLQQLVIARPPRTLLRSLLLLRCLHQHLPFPSADHCTCLARGLPRLAHTPAWCLGETQLLTPWLLHESNMPSVCSTEPMLQYMHMSDSQQT